MKIWLTILAFCLGAPMASAAELQLSPLTLSPLNPAVQAVQGADGDSHLVYELQLSNVSPIPWRVESVQALEQGKAIAELKGSALESRLGPLGKRGGSAELAANQTSYLWLHLKLDPKRPLPEKIEHRIHVTGAGKDLDIKGAAIAVLSEKSPLIAAPLRGERWVAGDGCCDSIRHVRALLPINGELHSSQRFAIDWEKLNEENKIFSGDAKNPENYFCYGQEVLAVADGTVAAMLDGLPNQVPGKLPEGLDINQADGNHVILKLNSGPYALYAHLKPGSIRVKTGDQVKEGQILAQVGNTGNTSEPHLHFHLMDGPSPLASNGIPYLLKSFEVLGRAPSTAAFDKAAADGSPLPIQKELSTHRDQMPLDLSLVKFP